MGEGEGRICSRKKGRDDRGGLIAFFPRTLESVRTPFLIYSTTSEQSREASKAEPSQVQLKGNESKSRRVGRVVRVLSLSRLPGKVEEKNFPSFMTLSQPRLFFTSFDLNSFRSQNLTRYPPVAFKEQLSLQLPPHHHHELLPSPSLLHFPFSSSIPLGSNQESRTRIR